MYSRFNLGGIARFLCFAFVAASNAAPVTAGPSYGNTYRIDNRFAVQLESTGGSINAVAAAPDGGFFVGGYFSTIGGQHHLNLAKVKSDGTVDPSYNQNGGPDGEIVSLTVRDGLVVVGGSFTAYNGKACAGIARLNANGTLDTSFDIGTGFGKGTIFTVVEQVDGKIVVGGEFTAFNGVACARGVVRLNANGTLDGSFNRGTGFDSNVYAIVIQNNEQIIVGGYFSMFNDAHCARIARLNADGSLDTSFNPNPNSGFDAGVYSLALQSDGRIIVGGDFKTYQGILCAGITRLNADGTLDAGFNSGSGLRDGADSASWITEALAIQSNGKIIVGGQFTKYNGVLSTSIAQLNTDGTIDAVFSSGSGSGFGNDSHPALVKSIAMQTDGRIAIGGIFTSYNGASAKNLVRLNTAGTLDTTLFYVDLRIPSPAVKVVSVGGKFIACGAFTWVNGTTCNKIARLNADGALDPTFNPGNGFDGDVDSLAVQTDGRIVAAGFFTTYNGTPRNNIARLNVDGSLDTSFNPPDDTVAIGSIYSLAIQTDGRAVIGGVFTGYTSTPQSSIARLNTDGTVDKNFIPDSAFHGSVYSLAVQADGNIVASGFSASVLNGDENIEIVRLKSNGTLDASFNTGTVFKSGYNIFVDALAVQTDGRVIVGGEFTPGYITRLNADGTLDATFNQIGGLDGAVRSFIVQTDGRIVVVGNFSNFDATQCRNIARLNANGSLDAGFSAWDLMRRGDISDVCYTDDGRLLVSGAGAASNGVLQIGFALLKPDVGPIFTIQPQSVAMHVGGTATFTSATSGRPAPSYQWYKGSVALSGQTNSSLTVSNIQSTDAGSYTVVALNSAGTATSSAATLTVDASTAQSPGAAAMDEWFVILLIMVTIFHCGERYFRKNSCG